MSKYCPLANAVTNCTDNCKSCMEEEHENAWNEAVDFGGIHMQKYEEEYQCQNTQNLNPSTKTR